MSWKLAEFAEPLEPHLTLYHGTTNRALELARQRGGLHSWSPRDVAHEVASHYGLDPEELYNHPYYEFSRSAREGDNMIYTHSDPRIAQTYANARSEQLTDALHTAHRMLNPQMYSDSAVEGFAGSPQSYHRDVLRADRDKFDNEYFQQRDIHPQIVKLTVPQSAIPANQQKSIEYAPSGMTFTLPAPVPLDWMTSNHQIDPSVPEAGSMDAHWAKVAGPEIQHDLQFNPGQHAWKDPQTGIRHQEWGRGLLTPEGTMHTWPTDGATHIEKMIDLGYAENRFQRGGPGTPVQFHIDDTGQTRISEPGFWNNKADPWIGQQLSQYDDRLWHPPPDPELYKRDWDMNTGEWIGSQHVATTIHEYGYISGDRPHGSFMPRRPLLYNHDTDELHVGPWGMDHGQLARTMPRDEPDGPPPFMSGGWLGHDPQIRGYDGGDRHTPYGGWYGQQGYEGWPEIPEQLHQEIETNYWPTGGTKTADLLPGKGGLYTAVPTTERDRVFQHGLKASDPTYNWPNPEKPYGPQTWLDTYGQRPPVGVYGYPKREQAEGVAYGLTSDRGIPHDIWHIPYEQIREIKPDIEPNNAWLVPHDIEYPSLADPIELRDRTWGQERDTTPEEDWRYQDENDPGWQSFGQRFNQGESLPAPLGIGRPDRVIGGTSPKPYEAKVFHGSNNPRGVLGPITTPFWTTSHQPEAEEFANDNFGAMHPVQVRFKNPAHYFAYDSWHPQALEEAQANGADGVVVHWPEDLSDPSDPYPTRTWCIALDPGTVVPGHLADSPLDEA